MSIRRVIIIILIIALAGALGFYVWLKIADPLDDFPLSQPVLNQETDKNESQLSQEEKEERVANTLKTMRENSADDNASREEKEKQVINALEKMRENSQEEKE